MRCKFAHRVFEDRAQDLDTEHPLSSLYWCAMNDNGGEITVKAQYGKCAQTNIGPEGPAQEGCERYASISDAREPTLNGIKGW